MAHAGRRVTRIGDQIDPESVDWTLAPQCATINGFSLHANVVVHAEDRLRLGRLVSYCARPPMAMERIEPLADGPIRGSFVLERAAAPHIGNLTRRVAAPVARVFSQVTILVEIFAREHVDR